MSELSYVLERIAQGDEVRFYHDYYGEQGVELARGRLLRRRKKVVLTAAQLQEVKNALRNGVRRAKVMG